MRKEILIIAGIFLLLIPLVIAIDDPCKYGYCVRDVITEGDFEESIVDNWEKFENPDYEVTVKENFNADFEQLPGSDFCGVIAINIQGEGGLFQKIDVFPYQFTKLEWNYARNDVYTPYLTTEYFASVTLTSEKGNQIIYYYAEEELDNTEDKYYIKMDYSEDKINEWEFYSRDFYEDWREVFSPFEKIIEFKFTSQLNGVDGGLRQFIDEVDIEAHNLVMVPLFHRRIYDISL